MKNENKINIHFTLFTLIKSVEFLIKFNVRKNLSLKSSKVKTKRKSESELRPDSFLQNVV